MRYSTKQLHNDLDILKICDLEYLESITFVKNFMLNKLPGAFSNYFSKPNHTFNTRGLNSLLVVPQSTNNFGASSMKIRGATRWNALSSKLKSVDNIHTFRKLWKKLNAPIKISKKKLKHNFIFIFTLVCYPFLQLFYMYPYFEQSIFYAYVYFLHTIKYYYILLHQTSQIQIFNFIYYCTSQFFTTPIIIPTATFFS